MSDPVSAGVPAGAEPGVLARFAGVLFSPGATFESIARKPAWVIPLLLLVVWTGLAGYLITSRIDVDTIMKKQIAAAEKKGQPIPENQIETMRTVTAGFIKFSFLIGVAWVVAIFFAVPGIYHGLAAAWGRAGTYTGVLSAYIHIQVVQVIKGALLLVVALRKTSIDPEGIPRLLKSNLGAFLDPETSSPVLLGLLTSIDVFDLWGMALAILALQKVTRLSRGSAATVVVGVWGAWVLITTAMAAVGAAFR